MNSSGNVVVITGGASGIGEATAKRFAAAGWTVVIGDIDETRGRAVAAEIAAGGTRCDFHRLDVSSEEEVERFATTVSTDHGPVAALVNSGGVLQNAVRVTKMPIEEFDRILDINVRGTLLVGRAFATRMVEAGRGSIVNLCSLTTFHPWPQPAYGVSKAGVKMLTEIMAAELGPQGVRVNAVAPGYTLTPAMKARIDRGERDPSTVIARSALRRFVEPHEVAEAIYFLSSPLAGAITGATLPIDCGWLVYTSYSAAAAQPA
ncbi:SDR family oxidoreductase [Bosea sp. 117]|uniref:SDR family NAD(P)-dependent oxidoreductase n=1 Tax=Bosea sp. 117 TaxID=1125973 RepID=UPI00049431D8|nr:SDR family oxidoreductase [Bosea sp. 117]